MRRRNPWSSGWRAALALACLVSCGTASAQNYPNRSVKIAVPYGAGGTTDIVTRIVAKRLSEIWGQSVIVENKPGAGGNIAIAFVAQSPPDGYTLLVSGASFAMNPGLYRSIPYDAEKDFFHITEIASTPSMLIVGPSLPTVTSVKELIEVAKRRPGELTYGSAGPGTTPHLAGELFSTMAGIKMLHVPYKLETMATQDVMTGRVDIFIGSVPSFRPQLATGRLRALAVTSSQRSVDLPDLPTISEAGLPGYEMTGWYGAYAPVGVSPEVANKLQADFIAAIRDPDTTARLLAAGAEPIASTPVQFAEFVRTEKKKWAAVAKNAGASID